MTKVYGINDWDIKKKLVRKSLKTMNLHVTSESCMKSKLTRLLLKMHTKPRSNRTRELIYIDIAGPITPESK